MRSVTLLSFCAMALNCAPPAERIPVLIEMFTSESCPNAPEADRLLERLDEEQPFDGVDLIVLSEHVDYYDALGWRDPYALPQFLARQRDYAQLLAGNLEVSPSVLRGTRSGPLDRAANETQVYTPEVIVDGATGFAGSDFGDAKRAVHEAGAREKESIRVSARPQEGKAAVSIHMDRARAGTLYLALAKDSVKSNVRGGPNDGIDFSHIAVVYWLQTLGRVTPIGESYDKEITLKIKPGSRIVAFVEEGTEGKTQDAVSLSAKALHKPLARSGVGRVTAIGQTRF